MPRLAPPRVTRALAGLARPPVRHSSSAARALVINAGSSSIKYGLFDLGSSKEPLVTGLVEQIGLPGSCINHTGEDGVKQRTDETLPDHAVALQRVVDLLTTKGGPVATVEEIDVVGHRVVHGGATMTTPTLVTDEVEAAIEAVVPLAPLHNPANLIGIRKARGIFPAPHIAVFDTAFHATMPAESYTYAVPRELTEKHGVRRYGFHGTSYTYVLDKVSEHLSRPKESLNVIMCHLGSGASMAAVARGKCVDTTMGMTPLEGLVMGTRAGDIDAGVVSFLVSGKLGYSMAEVDTLLNKQSGLKGMAGIGSSDWRVVRQAAADGDANAILARKVFVERIRKYVGAYMVKLGGEVDAIVFTGGIGENDPALREAVCANLSTLGVAIDADKNGQGLVEVQASSARVRTLVVPTNEELCLATQAAQAVGLI